MGLLDISAPFYHFLSFVHSNLMSFLMGNPRSLNVSDFFLDQILKNFQLYNFINSITSLASITGKVFLWIRWHMNFVYFAVNNLFLIMAFLNFDHFRFYFLPVR